jgi:hypothetical protein
MLCLQLLRQRVAFDVDVREDTVEPGWKPPFSVSEQSGHERHADEEGIGEDSEREAEADRLRRPGSSDPRPVRGLPMGRVTAGRSAQRPTYRGESEEA